LLEEACATADVIDSLAGQLVADPANLSIVTALATQRRLLRHLLRDMPSTVAGVVPLPTGNPLNDLIARRAARMARMARTAGAYAADAVPAWSRPEPSPRPEPARWADAPALSTPR
jgi:hypothetical protein